VGGEKLSEKVGAIMTKRFMVVASAARHEDADYRRDME